MEMGAAPHGPSGLVVSCSMYIFIFILNIHVDVILILMPYIYIYIYIWRKRVARVRTCNSELYVRIPVVLV